MAHMPATDFLPFCLGSESPSCMPAHGFATRTLRTHPLWSLGSGLSDDRRRVGELQMEFRGGVVICTRPIEFNAAKLQTGRSRMLKRS